MDNRPNCLPLLILIVVAVVTAVAPCFGQDWPSNGMGNTPMGQSAPITNDPRQRPVVPGPPAQPGVTSRPAAWPTSPTAVPEASVWVPPDQRSTTPENELKPCAGIRILARVGSEAILESEVIAAVNEVLEANKDRIPPDQVDRQRELLIQQRLKSLIQTKLIYQDARRTMPSEAWPQVERQLTKLFEENQLDKMMKKAGVSTARDFDLKLRALGSSLEREKRAFIEATLAQEWGRKQVKRDEEITYDQMVEYYRKHQDEFTTPANVAWEELMVRYSKYPSKAAAFDAIARMGNQVIAGAPFAEVAKAGSDGSTAGSGGQWERTSKGSLTNERVDAVLFSPDFPVNQMSRIIEGDKGYHIVRVTERKVAEVAPFLKAQVDIREKIIKERSEKQYREYIATLEARTPVWTIYDSKDGTLQLATPQSLQPTRR